MIKSQGAVLFLLFVICFSAVILRIQNKLVFILEKKSIPRMLMRCIQVWCVILRCKKQNINSQHWWQWQDAPWAAEKYLPKNNCLWKWTKWVAGEGDNFANWSAVPTARIVTACKWLLTVIILTMLLWKIHFLNFNLIYTSMRKVTVSKMTFRAITCWVFVYVAV